MQPQRVGSCLSLSDKSTRTESQAVNGQTKRTPASFASAWKSHALLGVLLLMMSVGVLEIGLTFLATQTRAASVAAGLAFCGGTAIAASWALYRRRPLASALYATSWGLLVVGWAVLGYASDLRPLWFTLGVAGAMSIVAVLSVMEVRRDMFRHEGTAPAREKQD